MRITAASALVLGACGFGSRGAPDDVRPIDAAPDVSDGPSGMPDAIDGSTPAFCNADDSHLMACYEFEGNTGDGSSHRLDAVATDVSFVTGRVGMAMQFQGTSTASVADSRVLDVADLTIEAWIRPSQLPTTISTHVTILEVNNQYALFLFPGPMLSCSLMGVPSVNAMLPMLAVNQWTHVACTHDSTGSALYVDGALKAQTGTSGALATVGNTGLSLAADNPLGGSRLIGLIDQVRLMDVARTAAQICTDAGKSSCP